MAAYDYPYFKLRLTSMGVEAEILRRAKPREVEGLYSWRASRALRGWCGFLLIPGSVPGPPPALVSYEYTPSVLKAALGQVRLPAVGVAGHKSLPLARRVGASFQRPLECIRTSYRSNFVDRCPRGP